MLGTISVLFPRVRSLAITELAARALLSQRVPVPGHCTHVCRKQCFQAATGGWKQAPSALTSRLRCRAADPRKRTCSRLYWQCSTTSAARRSSAVARRRFALFSVRSRSARPSSGKAASTSAVEAHMLCI